MKSLLLLGATAVAIAVAGAFGATGAPARPVAVKTVTIVMHDPGCHWFQVGTSYRKTLAVNGPVSLVNFDEAALKVVGPSGTKLDRAGKPLRLTHGTYRITMIGQAPDDNHLKLVVS